MASFNSVTLMGNLTRDPDLRYTSGGSPVCSFGLAINHKYTSNGEKKEEVTFVDITVWGRVAENCNEYLSKGSSVILGGRLQLDSWQTDDGQKRSKLRVVANIVQFLGGKQESQRQDDNKPEDDAIPF
jgi:single-strand DNA-binding protein